MLHSDEDTILGRRPFLPIVLALFVASGCAGLIYEIVWFQLLQLVVGSSAVSLGVLLATYMGGLCLGSLVVPRLMRPGLHPLRLYAWLELGVGLSAIAVVFAVPLVGDAYTAIALHGLTGIVMRGVVCGVCLLVPTFLMGATLPVLSHWVGSSRGGASWIGYLYAGNTAGAVFGSLFAGFVLLRTTDVFTGTCVAAALNVVIALAAFAIATRSPEEEAPAEAPVEVQGGAWPVYVAIGLSGLAALGAEVVWTRLLSLMLGGSVYTFSLILAVFLVGLALGAWIGSVVGHGRLSPRIAFGWCQLLQAGGIGWAALMIARSLPYWPIDPSLSPSPWFTFQLDLLRAGIAILPAAVLWGASFPLSIAAAAEYGVETGRLVGGLYAANTVGAIIGSLGLSIFGIPSIGTQDSQRLLIAVVVISALILFVPLTRGNRGISAYLSPRHWGVVGVGVLAAVLVGFSVANIPPGVVAYGRFFLTYPAPDYLYVGEGINSSVAVSQESNGVRNFHVAGKVEASTEPQDMRLQLMLGHLSALVAPHPKSVLIVGFGAGVTAGTFVAYPPSEISRIVICELEPLVPKAVAPYFGEQNNNVLQDPRVQVVYDDARHYVLTTKEKFDIITSDPINPWVKGAATLYTQEYFDLVKSHLNPGGVISQWIPLYESTPEAVKSEFATFFASFPNGTVWSNDINGKGYDVVVLGRNGSRTIDVEQMTRRFDSPDYAMVRNALASVGFDSPLQLLGTYAGRASDLEPWYKGAPINRDRNLRLQYLAGMGVNLYQNAQIYQDILHYRRFPDTLFSGTPDQMTALAAEIAGPER